MNYYIYKFLDEEDNVIYIGKTEQLVSRMKTHLSGRSHLPKECFDEVAKIKYLQLYSKVEMEFMENYHIVNLQPKYNVANIDLVGFNYNVNIDENLWETFYDSNVEVLIDTVEEKENKELDKKVYKFIQDITNVEKEEYPYIYKTFHKFNNNIEMILKLTVKRKFEKITDGEIEIEYFNDYGSIELTNMVIGKENSTKKQLEKVSKLLNLLSYVGIFKKLTDNDLPHNILSSLINSKKNKKYQYRKNIYKLNINDLELKQINLKCKELWDNGYTFKGFTKDFIALNISKEFSEEIFVQDKGKEISIKLQKFVWDLTKLLAEIDSGHILEVEIKDKLNAIGYSKSYIKNNYKTIINKAMEESNTEKLRLTNELKEIYKITEMDKKARPNIFVKIR